MQNSWVGDIENNNKKPCYVGQIKDDIGGQGA